MAVRVHSQRDLAVTKDLHHDPRGHAPGDQEASRGVAKIVQPDGRQASFAEQLLGLAVVVAGIDWEAVMFLAQQVDDHYCYPDN